MLSIRIHLIELPRRRQERRIVQASALKPPCRRLQHQRGILRIDNGDNPREGVRPFDLRDLRRHFVPLCVLSGHHRIAINRQQSESVWPSGLRRQT